MSQENSFEIFVWRGPAELRRDRGVMVSEEALH